MTLTSINSQYTYFIDFCKFTIFSCNLTQILGDNSGRKIVVVRASFTLFKINHFFLFDNEALGFCIVSTRIHAHVYIARANVSPHGALCVCICEPASVFSSPWWKEKNTCTINSYRPEFLSVFVVCCYTAANTIWLKYHTHTRTHAHIWKRWQRVFLPKYDYT